MSDLQNRSGTDHNFSIAYSEIAEHISDFMTRWLDVKKRTWQRMKN